MDTCACWNPSMNNVILEIKAHRIDHEICFSLLFEAVPSCIFGIKPNQLLRRKVCFDSKKYIVSMSGRGGISHRRVRGDRTSKSSGICRRRLLIITISHLDSANVFFAFSFDIRCPDLRNNTRADTRAVETFKMRMLTKINGFCNLCEL